RRAAPADRLDVLDHDDRPQADRDHVPGPDLLLLHAGRGRGAADAAAAGAGGQHAADAADLQRAVHDARLDDDLPVHRPVLGRPRELLRAAHDRRARHGVPDAERAVVLAARRRRAGLLRLAVLLPARVWVDVLRAAERDAVPAVTRR